jgi:molybdopterin molybdotransferase
MPQGADAVLIQENATRKGDHLEALRRCADERLCPARGLRFSHRRRAAGTGQAIGPAQIALALAAGHTHLPVRRAPTLAIIDSGDELARPGSQLAPHQIPASNGAVLAAQVRRGWRHHRIGPVADTMPALVEALDAAGGAMIVTSGGASVGDHDLVRPALERWGAQIAFWRVAIRPGKPLLIARRAGQMVIGLPGNPVSGLVTAHLFLRPLLRAMMGAARPCPWR